MFVVRRSLLPLLLAVQSSGDYSSRLDSRSSMISQEYFDEVCLENAELFDLHPDEAVAETIAQLQIEDDREHLTCTFPTSEEGIRERQLSTQLGEALEALATGDLEDALSHLQAILTCATAENLGRSTHLLLSRNGLETLLEVWKRAKTDSQERDVLMELWLVFLGHDAFVKAFQASLLPLSDWIESLATTTNDDDSRQERILSLALRSVRQCEDNKKAWMQQRTKAGLSLPTVLLDLLSQSTLIRRVCRFVTALCTFDDFRQPSEGPTVASTHDNVQAFHQANAVRRLHDALIQHPHEASLVLALRSMAIQDNVIQVMVASGTVTSMRQVLLEACQSKDDAAVDRTMASIGFFRNVCANDSIKVRFCSGDESIVPLVLEAMSRYPAQAQLQEHACGLLAAMALRQPSNATTLVHHEAHVWMVRAMQQHPTKATLQRQAALAIRNLVSRSPELRPIVRQQSEVEVTLRRVAASHLSCQDEVYAALRDLGLPVSMVEVHDDGTGALTVRKTRMFGERNPNFRPDFDESKKE